MRNEKEDIQVTVLAGNLALFNEQVPFDQLATVVRKAQGILHCNAITYVLMHKLDRVTHQDVLGLHCEHDIVRAEKISWVRDANHNTWTRYSSIDIAKDFEVYKSDADVIKEGRAQLAAYEGEHALQGTPPGANN